MRGLVLIGTLQLIKFFLLPAIIVKMISSASLDSLDIAKMLQIWEGHLSMGMFRIIERLNVDQTLFSRSVLIVSTGLYLSRGNHESKSMNKIYGFEGEVNSKFNETMVKLFAEIFCYLPLANVLNKKVFVVHGGLFSSDSVKLSDIAAIDRFREPPDEGTCMSETNVVAFHTLSFLSSCLATSMLSSRSCLRPPRSFTVSLL
jgi:hypothetical protein